MCGYADPTIVRKRAGNPGTARISDSEITDEIKRSDAIVNMHTKKYDWSTADPDYPIVQDISELYAASSIRRRFKDDDKVAEKMEDEGDELLEELLSSSPSLAATGKVTIKRRAYRTFPLELSADIFHSVTIAGGGGTGEGVPPFGNAIW